MEIYFKEDIPSIDCANICVRQLMNGFDPKFGGFSSAPKFPQPVNFNLLFLMHARDQTSEVGEKCLNMCILTLTKMANGGIRDHVGQVNIILICFQIICLCYLILVILFHYITI